MVVREPAGDPAALRRQADRAHRGPAQVAAEAAQTQRRHRRDQRLRRRARGRADLPLHHAARRQQEADPASVVAVDDPGLDPRRFRGPADRQVHAAAGRCRRVPFRVRLAGGDQRNARDDCVQFQRGRFLQDHRGPGADADAGHPGRARGPHQEVPVARLLGSACELRRRRGQLQRALVRREVRQGGEGRGRRSQARAPVGCGARRRLAREMRGQARHRHRGSQAHQPDFAAAVRSDQPAARSQRTLRFLRARDAVAGAGALRKAQGADLPAHRRARAAGGLSADSQIDHGNAGRQSPRQGRGRRGLCAVRAPGIEGRLGQAEQAHFRQFQDFRPLRHYPHAAGAGPSVRRRGQAL